MKFSLMKCIDINLYFYANLWKHNKILRIRVTHVNGDRLISYNSITLGGYISNMKAL